MSTTKRGSIPHVFEELMLVLAGKTASGATGTSVEVAVAKNVKATIDFTYSPGRPAENLHGRFEDAIPAEPAEVAIRAIKATDLAIFEGEKFSASAHVGADLLELLTDRQITALEDMIIERAERK